MAITVTELTGISQYSSANSTTFNTNTLTATANKLYLIAVEGGYSTARTLSSVTGGGLGTWTIVSGCSQENAAQTRRSEVAYAWSATPGAGAAVAVAFSGATTGCGWHVYEITGFNTSSPVGISGKATGVDAATGSPTLASASSGSALLAFLQHVTNEATTVEAGWTAGVNLTGTGHTISSLSAYRLLVDDLGATFNWTTIGIFVSSIIEIKAAADTASGALTPTVEFWNGSSWVDFTADILTGSLSWTGGMKGGEATDRVAPPGTCEFALKNSTGNSGGLLGYYSPDHANKRAGWALGAKIRITMTSGGVSRYWQYRVKSITPIPGQYGPRRVEVIAMDYMEEFSKRKVSGLTIQTNKTGDQLLTTLVASMPFAPGYTNYGTGTFAFAYAFHTEQDESTSCLTVLQKISQSGLTYVYQDGSNTQAQAETLRFEPHTERQGVTAAAALSDTMTDLVIDHSVDSVVNFVRADTYPVEIDTDLSVLGSITEEFALEPSETRTVYVQYRDVTSERRISGTGLVTPVVDTDYKMSSVPGGGNDMNASLTVTPTAGANTLLVVVANGSATTKGYVNLLQMRGYAVRTFDKVESVESDSASMLAYGEGTLTFNMPYQNGSAFGEAVATEIVRRYKDPASQISSVSFIANKSATFMTYALTVGIGSRITVSETATGIDGAHYVNGFEYELLANDILRVTWILERAFNEAPYFTLDHATYGLLDGAYVLAPF